MAPNRFESQKQGKGALEGFAVDSLSDFKSESEDLTLCVLKWKSINVQFGYIETKEGESVLFIPAGYGFSRPN